MADMSKVDIIGVPMDYGGNRRGVDMGPSAIRYSGLKKVIAALNLEYRDLGNIDVPLPEKYEQNTNSNLRYLKEIRKVNSELFDFVLKSHKDGHFPLVLGGDHSLAVGSALATNAFFENVGIIWIDAHADYNTSKSTISGNLHGMPLSAVTGAEKDVLTGFLGGDLNYISPKNAVIIAARDLDILEAELLKESEITVFSMQHIDLNGMRKTVKQAIEIASKDTRGFHTSFDLDAVSPKEAPGVGTPVKGGLTYREAHLAMEMISMSKKMLSLDIVELNPITDHGNITGELSVSLIESALGKKII